jgi:hypothetical protein
MKPRSLTAVALCIAATAACSQSTPAAPGGAATRLAAPAAASPADQAQLATLRPTLSVTNSPSAGAIGTRTYEFQVSDKSDFSSSSSTGSFPAIARQTGITEGSGTTSYTPDFDLQPATRLFWRARLIQGTDISEWSSTRSFNTAIVGYNRPGELYDPLVFGSSVGVVVGSSTFISGQGIRLNDGNAYVRYQLAAPLSVGEFSLEIAGLHADGPGAKLKLFEMSDSAANVYNSPWLFTAQYRGVNGNPDNCISFKMRLADPAFQLEADARDRANNVMSLDPAHFYFFRAMWNDGFRMIIQNSIGGDKIYDLEYRSTDYFSRLIPYQPTPHFAYLGGNDQTQGPENGTFPGEIVRNVFISNHPRPASLGSAIRVQ